MKEKKAFTLAELMVVVAIIAILAVVLVPKIMNNKYEAKLTKTITDAHSIETYLAGKEITPEQTIQILQNTNEFKELDNAFSKNIKGIHLNPITNSDSIPINKQIIVYSEEPSNTIINSLQDGVIAVYNSKAYYRQQRSENIIDTTPVTNNKPIAVITMTPDQDITTITTVNWNHLNSIDPDGGLIVDAEWQGKQDLYTTEGTYTIQLRVKNSKNIWSDWTSKEIYVVDSKSIKQIYSGAFYTVILKNDGSVWAWGQNNDGQLGDGTIVEKTAPKQIISSGIQKISTGMYHTLALKTDGSVWAWGKQLQWTARRWYYNSKPKSKTNNIKWSQKHICRK